jgi:hypothetical protein
VNDVEIDDPMLYIKPTDEHRVHMDVLRTVMTAAYQALLRECPPSAERTLAVRKLQEARMWANFSIVLDGKTYRR